MLDFTQSGPRDMLYRYLSRDQFRKRFGFYHPDPMIEEFTYGEGASLSTLVWNNVGAGSRLFFHTMVGGERYLTAMYSVADLAPAPVWREDRSITKRLRNHHLHPAEYGAEDGFGLDPLWEARVRKEWREGKIIPGGADVVIVGDPDLSLDIRKTPVPLDRAVMARLDLDGKPVKRDIVDKKGRQYDEGRCVSTCLRPPRVLSEGDGDYLEALVRQAVGAVADDPSLSLVYGIDSFLASDMQLNCATESEIESLLVGNLDAIEKGLKLTGRQVTLRDGNRIDILARTRAGAVAVIEVKKGTADDRTLAQIIAYMHQFKKENPGCALSGKVVCADASYRMRMACEHMGITIHCYGDIFTK